jgi:hypothetical protein
MGTANALHELDDDCILSMGCPTLRVTVSMYQKIMGDAQIHYRPQIKCTAITQPCFKHTLQSHHQTEVKDFLTCEETKMCNSSVQIIVKMLSLLHKMEE